MNNIDCIIVNNEETLKQQSQSFAIPLLKMEQNFKLPIMAQYNLCKTIDTIEDSVALNPDEKIDLMNEVCRELKKNRFSEHVIKEMIKVTPEAEAYVFRHAESIVALFDRLSSNQQQLGLKYLDEMAMGMVTYLKKAVASPNDLNQYCYSVAGSVGMYLTELLQTVNPKVGDKRLHQMKQDGKHFGLFLQKLNIIRDYRSDLELRYRHFWPTEYFQNKKNLTNVLDIMCEETIVNDIEAAIRYWQSIPTGCDSFDFFIRYILKSGMRYMGMLRGNFMVFFMDKIKLDRTFVNNLYDKVAKQDRRDFLEEMQIEHSLLKEAYQSDRYQ